MRSNRAHDRIAQPPDSRIAQAPAHHHRPGDCPQATYSIT
jgi:hypothetical protein